MKYHLYHRGARNLEYLNNNTNNNDNEISITAQQSNDNRVQHSNTLSDPWVDDTNTELEAIQPANTIQNNTTAATMDTNSGIIPSRSNHQFSMALTSIYQLQK